MKNTKKLFSLLLVLCLMLGSLCGCQQDEPAAAPSEPQVQPSEPASSNEPSQSEETLPEQPEWIDYAGKEVLDMSTDTAKQEVTVKTYVDGDTVHFYVPQSVMPSGVLKGRFLAINTPESTGKIEEYGKAASRFTQETLRKATSIIIESETPTWNADSTGDRYLVWVWYKTADSDSYRNLNLEILQNGLAIANNTGASRYGKSGVAAIDQAKAYQLNMFSGKPDPEFYYGDAVELTLSELRNNIEKYNGMKVAFNGVITREYSQTVYVEDYDSENDVYYGMAVYYGYNLNGQGLKILSVGNKVRIVGTVQYYEAGGTWQVSDLNYRMMQPDDPSNIKKLSEGHSAAYTLMEPSALCGDTVELLVGDEMVTMSVAQLAMNTSIEMKNLHVYDAYTTKKETSASQGAMTLYCQVGNQRIAVRTTVLYDANGQLVTQDRFLGKTIDVKGLIDYLDGNYQIKVFNINDITIH